jgi:hypothetical protein
MSFRGDRPHLRDRLESAFQTDDPRIGRLGGAGTSVCFQVLHDPTQSVTVLLDRDPPAVLGGDEPAEITIELDEQQAERLARGGLSLPPALLAGQIAYRGPVRKYLMVDPVLRALLADLEGAGGH